MQIVSKLITLDLDYSHPDSHAYQQQRYYVSPWQGESAQHFAKRLLMFLSLYEQHPGFAVTQSHGKTPDIFVKDTQQQVAIWCQLEPIAAKRLQRASHLAAQVLLVLDEQEAAQCPVMTVANQRTFVLHQSQLDAFCLMLKSHMRLSVFREDPLLQITDGQHVMQLNLTALLDKPH